MTMTSINKISLTAVFVTVGFVVFGFMASNVAFAQTSCGNCGGGTTPGGLDDGPDGGGTVKYPPSCQISASVQYASDGQSYTIYWNGSPSNATFKVNNDLVSAKGSATYTFDGGNEYERFVFYGKNGDGECADEVYVYPKVEVPKCDISANVTSVNEGGQYTITWNGTPAAASFKINGSPVTDSGSKTFTFVGPNQDKFTLTGENGQYTCRDEVVVTVKPKVEIPKCDFFTATPSSLPYGGGNVTLNWGTTNANEVRLDGQTVSADGSQTVNVTANRTFTITVKNASGEASCSTAVHVGQQAAPKCDFFTATPSSLPYGGGNVTLNWGTTNANEVRLDGQTVSADGSQTVNVTANRTFTLTVRNASGEASCSTAVHVGQVGAPKCEAFTANPDVFTNGTGGTFTLTWDTTNVSRVTIDNGVGTFNGPDGSTNVSLNVPEVSSNLVKTYTLTAEGINGQTVSCQDTVTIKPKPQDNTPRCDAFSFNPSNVKPGQTTTLSWQTTNLSSVTIDNGIGTRSGDGSVTVTAPNTVGTYTYTLTGYENGKNVSCSAVLKVEKDPEPDVLRCDFFRVNDSSVRRGDTVTLSWETTGAREVSIDQGIGSQALDGSYNYTVNSDTTFTLTARAADGRTVSCSTSVDVESGGGGGGGGSSAPRCEFRASDRSIRAGERVELTWETSRGDELVIYEGRERDGDEIYETDDEDDVDEGRITVRPDEDTTYTLVVEDNRGRDRSCTVRIEVEEEDVTVLTDREQFPRVAGIALTQVPYTGFEAGPMLTALFYILLTLWGLFVAYTFAIKKDSLLGFSLAGAFPRRTKVEDLSTDAASASREEVVSQAAAYVASATAAAPVNLPVAPAPVVGYANAVREEEESVEDTTLSDIENRAHSQHVLLSSDAMRYFTARFAEAEQFEALDALIKDAKAAYPSEDGWVVLNLERMQSLLEESATEVAATVAAAPETRGAGSLAEAIVTGNVAAAYAMIGHRPMIALADAAADLDGLYRVRQGGDATISDLLRAESKHLSDEQLHAAIVALTSALDGIYSSEAEAVKMAIMKAVKSLR